LPGQALRAETDRNWQDSAVTIRALDGDYSSTLLRVKVSIEGSEPAIWRLLEVGSSLTLPKSSAPFIPHQLVVTVNFVWRVVHSWEWRFLLTSNPQLPCRTQPTIHDMRSETAIIPPFPTNSHIGVPRQKAT
jgi:hypothetical protein